MLRGGGGGAPGAAAAPLVDRPLPRPGGEVRRPPPPLDPPPPALPPSRPSIPTPPPGRGSSGGGDVGLASGLTRGRGRGLPALRFLGGRR